MTSNTPINSVAVRPDEDLPVLPSELEDAWQKVEQSKLGDRMRSALRLIACGENVRASAEIVGLASHADVYRAAKRYGLIDVRTNKLIDRHRRISNLAGEELENRLTEDPDKISTQQLGILQGISTDKVLASDKASVPDGGQYLSALDRLAEKVLEAGAGFELRLSVKPQPSADEVIDVTPTGDVSTER
jgi:hypothetical protein